MESLVQLEAGTLRPSGKVRGGQCCAAVQTVCVCACVVCESVCVCTVCACMRVYIHTVCILCVHACVCECLCVCLCLCLLVRVCVLGGRYARVSVCSNIA